MVNKKGWLRIIEATITVLLIISIMFYVSQRNKPIFQEESLSEKNRDILKEIYQNEYFRTGILKDNGGNSQLKNQINDFIKSRIPSSVEHPGQINCQSDACSVVFLFRICSLTDGCEITPELNEISGEIYSSEAIISTEISESDFNPKKIKLYLWKK
jgi:hypothetical protein